MARRLGTNKLTKLTPFGNLKGIYKIFFVGLQSKKFKIGYYTDDGSLLAIRNITFKSHKSIGYDYQSVREKSVMKEN